MPCPPLPCAASWLPRWQSEGTLCQPSGRRKTGCRITITGRPAKPFTAEGVEAELLEHVRQMCEWRLGRARVARFQDEAPDCEPLDVPTLILCLKRLVKSVNKWTKHGGRQGYLDFMTQFIK